MYAAIFSVVQIQAVNIVDAIYVAILCSPVTEKLSHLSKIVVTVIALV